jgi:hypothetical protein
MFRLLLDDADVAEVVANRSLGTYCYASEDLAQDILSRTATDDGRSPFMWIRLATGDLILGVWPHGETYFEIEAAVEADFKGCPRPRLIPTPETKSQLDEVLKDTA